MSNEFLTGDKMSTKSNSSQQDNIDEEYIGQGFPSSIRVSDLAIQSTAYTMSSTLPTVEVTTTQVESEVELPFTSTKAKRRVTFNLDNIQIKTISDYESVSTESSDTSSLQYEEEEDENQDDKKNVMSASTLCTKYQDEQPTTSAERISKKASYDALQKRKQFRRDNQQPTTKPGYWYPLASPRTPSTTRLTPTIRSLELTEKLINETIQREMLLNPNIQQYTPPSPSPSPRSDINEFTCLPIISNNVLISDTKEDEEKEEGNEDQLITIISLDEEINEETSSRVLFNEEEEEEEEKNFFKSVYHQVLPISDYEAANVRSPIEQYLIPIVTNKDVLIISPPPSPQINEIDKDNDNLSWIDHTSLLINKNSFQKQERRGIFFVKVLKAESLDFPIENDHIKTFCTINYKGNIIKSNYQNMAHTMEINHEMRINDIDSKEQISITIHVDKKGNLNNWYHRIKSSSSSSSSSSSYSSDLERYIHDKDGSICQTLFCPDRFTMDGSIDQKATLMLVNNWYHESNSSSLLLKRSSFKKKKKPCHNTKAVGKIYIQCLYITVSNSCKYIPKNMNEAIEALNTKRFHQTKWKSGYLLHKNEKSKPYKKRYFTLTGGNLFVQLSKQEREPLYKISLSNVTKLIWDKSNEFQFGFENDEFIYFSSESLDELKNWISVLEVMIYKLPKLPEWITS